MLFLTHLFPNAAQPHEAPFNRQLAAALARRGPLTVMAPLLCPPWWSLTWRRRVPERETIDGVEVSHPRVLYTPGLGLAYHAGMMRRALRRPLHPILHPPAPSDLQPSTFNLQPVLIGFLYPDAVAVAPLLRAWNLPYALRLNGSDFYARITHPRIGPLIRRELCLAPRIFCPGQRLAEAVCAVPGVAAAQVVAFRNGVDRTHFHPSSPHPNHPPLRPPSSLCSGEARFAAAKREQAPALQSGGKLPSVECGGHASALSGEAMLRRVQTLTRRQATASQSGGKLPPSKAGRYRRPPPQAPQPATFNLPPSTLSQPSTSPISPSVLYVGHLKRGKGVDRLLRAWARLGDAGGKYALVIVGEGPERRRLEDLARTLGVRESVRFVGEISHPAVAETMRRADCLCLPSHSEGMPNVVVEALACGCPVVATDVGEVPNLVRDGVNGYVVKTVGRADPAIVADLADALTRIRARAWEPETIAATVRDCDWDPAAAIIYRPWT